MAIHAVNLLAWERHGAAWPDAAVCGHSLGFYAAAVAAGALDHDLPVERERDERGALRRDGLAQALADEAALAEHRDRAALQHRIGRVLKANRAERVLRVPALTVGTYKLKVEKPGFKSAEVSGLTITVDSQFNRACIQVR